MELRVLLVEDDASISRGIAQAFRLEQIPMHVCTSVEQALSLISDPTVGAVVSDVRLPGQDGFAMLAAVRQFDIELPIVLITAYAHIALAIQAIREGAYDFIEKPFSVDRLVDVVRRALEKRRLVLDNRRLRDALREQDGSLLVGHSSAIERARQRVAALAAVDVDILISGETGTGKEVIARALHETSERKGNFVAINCGAIPETVFDSEIFGHEAGSFTGAQKRRIGKIEHANHGTLFLDEIENMPLAMQVKFLRVLQERKLERLGSNDSVPVSFRVVAATKESLRNLSDEGKFRSDLYYRLNVVTIDMPALRDRREDIPVLLQHFTRMASARRRPDAAGAGRGRSRPPRALGDGLRSHGRGQQRRGRARRRGQHRTRADRCARVARERRRDGLGGAGGGWTPAASRPRARGAAGGGTA